MIEDPENLLWSINGPNPEINTQGDISMRAFTWSGMSLLGPWERQQQQMVMKCLPIWSNIWPLGGTVKWKFLWNEIFSALPVNKPCHSYQGFQPSKCKFLSPGKTISATQQWWATSSPISAEELEWWGSGEGGLGESLRGRNPPYLLPLMVNEELRIAAVQWQSCVWLFGTPWTAPHQASLSFTISWWLLKFMSSELMMPSNQLILCHPLLLCLQSRLWETDILEYNYCKEFV